MDTTGKPADRTDEPVIASGVDEEAIEDNRRVFSGRVLLLISGLATFYAAFHMAALNGVSLRDWTGIALPLLPQFPLETWNFRIVHISGALALGFLLFSAQTFQSGHAPGRARLFSLLAAALAIPVLVAGATAIGFAMEIASGTLPQMGGLTTWAAFPGTEIYAAEVNWFGIP
ncbi:MAG: TRAP transporter permease, partial [Pseudomonadota bacterium]